jgi:hypothetical protein
MLEKDIEHLIAQHPEDFFPREQFRLISEQYQIDGKRIDILFEDKHSRKIIVEVKRGILSREASGQVIEYYGLLKNKFPNEIFELILCANIIPRERSLFLEQSGIECKELGIAYIAEIAKKYNYVFLDENKEEIEIVSQPTLTNQNIGSDSDITTWIFQGNPNRYDVLNALNDPNIGNNIHWLVNQHKNKIKEGHNGLIWMSGPDAGIYAITRITCDPQMLTEFPAERNYWLGEEEEEKQKTRVLMNITRRLVNSPILKKDLKDNPELQQLSILKHFQGTNFPVNKQEWNEIMKLIQK